MGSPDIHTALDWRGRTVVDRDGEKIGTLKEIYLDEAERPGWGSVHTALFGLRQTLVPLSQAMPDGDRLQVPYDREVVKSAPNVDPEVQIDPEEEQRLYRHYGLGDADADEPAGPGEGTAGASPRAGAVASERQDEIRRDAEPAAGHDAGGPAAGDPAPAEPATGDTAPAEPATGDSARTGREAPAEEGSGAEMIRSEEEVHVGKRVRERGRARLKKYVVTDYVETKVPVRREEVRIERDPPDEEPEPGR
jgi:stress response protein YsnF/sporulation protein YlmC with PRC-barrel domain